MVFSLGAGCLKLSSELLMCADLQAAWSNAKYSMQMLYAPELAFQSCWADTDALFAAMPDWGQQPIQIRHPFCFYYGHVAAFAKLKALPQVLLLALG